MDLDMIWYLCSSIVNFCAAGPPSPARPSTPQSRSSPVPPPPPPRPSSRPKLPPGKPISDLVRTNFPIISLSLCLFIFLRPIMSFTMLYTNGSVSRRVPSVRRFQAALHLSLPWPVQRALRLSPPLPPRVQLPRRH